MKKLPHAPLFPLLGLSINATAQKPYIWTTDHSMDLLHIFYVLLNAQLLLKLVHLN